MSLLGRAARSAALAVLRGGQGAASSQGGAAGSGQTAQLQHNLQQLRAMGGGGAGGPWHRSYDGKPAPAQFQTPEFITYAGLTLPRARQDWDYWSSKAMGAVVWFTLFYHFALNWEEHWYGDIGVFERDVQTNGWDDDGHGHGHKAAHH